jgi:hypothetical protein
VLSKKSAKTALRPLLFLVEAITYYMKFIFNIFSF